MMKQIDNKLLISKIRSIVKTDEFIALHEPVFMGNEKKYVNECIDTGWVSSVGKFVNQFEEQLADFVGAKRAVAVVNGTAALHIGLKIAGVNVNDEVLIPSLTFIATANAVTYCGATPHFVDIEFKTLGIDPEQLDKYLNEISHLKDGSCINKNTGKRISAIVPMHTFGHPVDLDKLIEVTEKYNITIVEDAAESLGSYYKGKHTGNFGKVSAFSFNGNKVITTGGGGAIVTNDEKLADFAKHITTTAKIPHAWEFVHDEIGYNYRMPNINAALGCAQLEQLPLFLEQKRKLSEAYSIELENVSGIKFFTEPLNSKSNYWLNTIIIEEDYLSERDNLLKELNDAGIMARPIWKLMHKLPMYMHCPSMKLDNSINLEKRVINIPSGAKLGGQS